MLGDVGFESAALWFALAGIVGSATTDDFAGGGGCLASSAERFVQLSAIATLGTMARLTRLTIGRAYRGRARVIWLGWPWGASCGVVSADRSELAACGRPFWELLEQELI
ncbi:MAG: hypothetical protein AAGF11_48820 [Myxococcota bacterium]